MILFWMFFASTAFADLPVTPTEPLVLDPLFIMTAQEPLQISDSELVLDDLPDGTKKVSIKLKGNYAKSEWNILLGSDVVKLSGNRDFNLQIVLVENQQNLTFTEIGPFGEVETKSFLVHVRDWDLYKIAALPPAQENPENKRWSINTALALTYSSFGDHRDRSVTQLAPTLKAGSVYRFKPTRWLVGLSFYYSFAPILHSPDTLPNAQYYGINGRVGYRLPQKILDFDPTVLLGWYYWGMIVPQSKYGLSGVFGPQMFISGSKELLTKRILSVYLKYAPLSETAGIPNPLNHELAIGGSWTIFADSRYGPLLLTSDFSELSATFNGSGRKVSIQTVSVGLGKEF